MKKLIVFIIFITCFYLINFVYASELSESDNIPEEAYTMAEYGLSIYKTKVIADPEKWGFSSPDEAMKTYLGEGFEVYYIGKDIISAENTASLLAFRDTEIYATWDFIIEYENQPKSFIFVYRDEALKYHYGFGGNANYFSIAREAYKKEAGESSKPKLLKIGSQSFLVMTYNKKESILPVPYDNISADIVSSGNGFIDPAQVIGAFRATLEMLDTNEPIRGNRYVNVWMKLPEDNKFSLQTILSIVTMVLVLLITIIAVIKYTQKIKHL